MNIIYLSPHFPPNYYLFCVHLRKLGANVLGIGDAPYDHLRYELREALTEYYRVDDMNDYDQLLRACGYFTHIYGKLDRVESLNEYWLEYEARLRTDFNIFGIKYHQISKITHKSEMKKMFQSAGIPVARGRILKNMESAQSLVQETGYPLVFKPNQGVGAANTFMIRNNLDLKEFFDNMPLDLYIGEEFIEGTIYSFDGLTDHDGNIVFYTSHVFSQGIMETVNEDRDLFYYSLREIPKALERAGHAAVKTFDLKEKFFHIEFFRTPDDEFVGLEVNARPPGGLTTDMFNYANELDVYKEWADIMISNHFSASCSRTYHCGYISRKLNKNYAHSHRNIIQKYGPVIVHHTPIASIFSAAIGNYAYIVNCKDVEKIIEAAAFIQEII